MWDYNGKFYLHIKKQVDVLYEHTIADYNQALWIMMIVYINSQVWVLGYRVTYAISNDYSH
jgi:hypothetical protein